MTEEEFYKLMGSEWVKSIDHKKVKGTLTNEHLKQVMKMSN